MTNMSDAIYVTRSFLPPREEFDRYVNNIWRYNQLTNNGPLSTELEQKLVNHLQLDEGSMRILANGTLALQLSLRALNITEGEVITTPFSYVATTSAIMWERCTPVFVDIDPHTLNIDPTMIEKAITPKTKAILAVHVFGNPCDIDAIQKIADKHDLRVIYDAAHAFGVSYKSKSIFSYGDISVCSFHATKLYHTIEGGAVFSKDRALIEKVELLKRFGHNGDDHILLGVNAKINEFNAAMGLANLKYIDDIIKDRKRAHMSYRKLLGNKFDSQKLNNNTEYNYSYYPIIFRSEEELIIAKNKLEENRIYPRRYFYPSLNNLSYIDNKISCRTSDYVSKRVLCLPIYFNIEQNTIERICNILNY